MYGNKKNKIIIGALIVVILALLIGILVSMPNSTKIDSKLEIIGNDTLNEGDNLQIKLTDTNGTALVNQTVKITFTDKDNSASDYSVVTNDEGVGELKLDKNAGEYDVTVIYAGNDGYNSCNATKKITIKEKVVEAKVTSSSSSSSNGGNSISYDSNLNVYYDSNGIIVDPDGKHPQNVGKSYQEVLNFKGMGD